MDAKSQMLEYAKQKNHTNVYSDEAFVGKMASGGVVIDRTSNSRTVAEAKREGRSIVVNETVITENSKVVDGKVETYTTKETTEVMRLSL